MNYLMNRTDPAHIQANRSLQLEYSEHFSFEIFSFEREIWLQVQKALSS